MEDGQELVIDTTGVGSEAALRQAEPFGSDVLIRLQKPAAFTVEVGGNAVLRIEQGASGLVIDLGPDAEERVLLGDSFQGFLNRWLKTQFDAHTHGLPDGQMSTPPSPGFTGAQVPDDVLSDVTKVK